MMLAAGGPPLMVRFWGSTLSVLGAAPKEHIIIAPEQTNWAMDHPFRRIRRISLRTPSPMSLVAADPLSPWTHRFLFSYTLRAFP